MSSNDPERQGDAYMPIHIAPRPSDMPSHKSVRDQAIDFIAEQLVREGFGHMIARHAAEKAVDKVRAEPVLELKHSTASA